MAKYKCSVCGYIYDEEKEGQPLLDSKCPVCGMTMVLMEENDSEAAASTALEADAAPEELAYDPAYARCDASCRHMDDIHEMAVRCYGYADADAWLGRYPAAGQSAESAAAQ